jgi:hypothetical protein
MALPGVVFFGKLIPVFHGFNIGHIGLQAAGGALDQTRNGAAAKGLVARGIGLF